MVKIKVDGREYDVVVFVAVFNRDTNEVVGEYDNIREARKCFNEYSYDFKYGAAEIINDDGDVNPAVYADTRKEAIAKLKKVL